MVKSDLVLNDNAKNIENNPQQIQRYKLRRNVIPFKYQHCISKYQLQPNHFCFIWMGFLFDQSSYGTSIFRIVYKVYFV